MEVARFIHNYRIAFGEKPELPLVFWYSDKPLAETQKVNGCFFQLMDYVRDGGAISLNAGNIGCGGGKMYTGFSEMPAHVPNFVSLKEKYKETPEMVLEYLKDMELEKATGEYLNFARIDSVTGFENVEGLFFFATTDELSGLTAWAFFDNNAPDAVSTPFATGCGSVVSMTVAENRRSGKRTFIGLLDPSVRKFVTANKLGFLIPMSRFREMYHTMPECCLFDTHAWSIVRDRINGK